MILYHHTARTNIAGIEANGLKGNFAAPHFTGVGGKGPRGVWLTTEQHPGPDTGMTNPARYEATCLTSAPVGQI